MIVGERMRKARTDKNMSQQDLGDILEVSKVSICGYEKGTRIPTLDKFEILLDALDLTPDYLLGRDVSVVSDKASEYKIKLAKEDIKIIKELKHNTDLYNKLKSDPKRTIELINRKLNK